MRKPGSKGAPTALDFKTAAGKKTGGIAKKKSTSSYGGIVKRISGW